MLKNSVYKANSKNKKCIFDLKYFQLRKQALLAQDTIF